MTNDQIEAIYKANIDKSRMTALRAIWNAGWCDGAAVTPKSTSPDKSAAAAKPTAIINLQHCAD